METELRIAFYTAINAIAAERDLHVVHPNTSFDPADLPRSTTHYLRTAVLPATPESTDVGAGASFIWLCQVGVYARADIGELAPLRHAQALREALPDLHQFHGDTTTFEVIRTASILPPVPSGAWFFFPVQLRVQAFQ